MADILIDQVEGSAGLRKAIEIRAATPLTNMRHTSNPRGAVYGWDQTRQPGRPLPQRTPVKNLSPSMDVPANGAVIHGLMLRRSEDLVAGIGKDPDSLQPRRR
jgi:phytoene dehydrogenase-like protein